MIASSSAIALKTKKFVITQCACINDGVTLKKKYTALELKKTGMDDIEKQKKKKSGNDSINRDDPEEYMRTRLKEDFNSIQLIACSRLFPIIRIVPQRWALRTIWPLHPGCNCNIITRFLKRSQHFNCTWIDMSYIFVSYKIFSKNKFEFITYKSIHN